MRKSTFVIISIWVAAYTSVVLNLLKVPTRECVHHYPSEVALMVVVMPFALFGIAALTATQSPWYSSTIARYIDARVGSGAYESFLVRFRPLLFFGIGGLISGMQEVWWCHQSGIQASIQLKGWFPVSGGLAFIVAHIILRLRKVQGV